MITVFLLDDHALVRTGYRLILQEHLDIRIIGESDNGEEGLSKIRSLKPDVVLCDLHMPGLSGLEITERVPVEVPPNDDSRAYLMTKRDKMGHLLKLV